MNRHLYHWGASVILAISLIGCGQSDTREDPNPKSGDAERASYEQIGEFRGYALTNRIINDRLIKQSGTFELAHYLEKKVYETEEEAILGALSPDLKDLLGKYDGNGVNSGFRNGLPNAINMLLWYVAFSGLGQDVAKSCDQEQNTFNAEANEVFSQLCTWPHPEATSAQTLENLWHLLMQYDAPASEFEAWQQYLQSQEFQGEEKHTAITNMIVSSLYNPYFLLQQ